MSSSAAPSSLSRILWGSLIGAAIGLVLLALGVAILWNAADQRLAETQAAAPSPAAATSAEPMRQAAEASPVPYPVVAPGEARPAVPIEPEPASAATSIWRSIFDDEAETAEAAAPAAAAPRAAPAAAAPRPAPRPATPRRPPEAQRQDESLFF